MQTTTVGRAPLTAKEREFLQHLLEPELEYARELKETSWAREIAQLMRKLGVRAKE